MTTPELPHSNPPRDPHDPLVTGRLFDSARLEPASEPQDSRLPPSPAEFRVAVRRRRLRLPVLLFLATCLSTFWVGSTQWEPFHYLAVSEAEGNFMPVRRVIWHEWPNGLIYMVSVLAILLSHEMGHFVMTLRYRIPASFPFFLPMPIIPLGTMGAVIAMDGSRADRKEIFDIGIAGPLAGLVFAVPLALIGLAKLDFTIEPGGPYIYDLPLAMRLILNSWQPAGYVPGQSVYHNQLNPYFMAGWVGFLVTGLNMLPVSQLDGGHVIYCLFRQKGKWISRAFLISAIAFLIYAEAAVWVLMIVIVILIGPDHPPTRNDNVELGWPRTILGWCSLLIPILCFSVRALRPVD